MKCVQRLAEPVALATYRANQPNSSWDAMRNDALNGGMAAHRAIKRTAIAQQRCLCAYCEMRIARDVPVLDNDANIPGIRIDHFHPKSDIANGYNWNLDWSNLWAVCDGGDNWPPEAPEDPRHRVEPKAENLSCDAFKNRQVQSGQLAANVDGLIFSPALLPAFPSLFRFSTNGDILPDDDACAAQQIVGNQHADTKTLVEQTIRHLNLNCPRLARLRENVVYEMDDWLENLRTTAGGNTQQDLANYTESVFSGDSQKPWPEFFTLMRWLLGRAAEVHLTALGFVG